MWEQYKNQIIMAVAGTILTGLLGFGGKLALNAYNHLTTVHHVSPDEISDIKQALDDVVTKDQFADIGMKLARMEAMLENNRLTLDQMRYEYLEEKRTSHPLTVNERSEWSRLTAKLFPGGLPQ